jgi:hypothetical protein
MVVSGLTAAPLSLYPDGDSALKDSHAALNQISAACGDLLVFWRDHLNWLLAVPAKFSSRRLPMQSIRDTVDLWRDAQTALLATISSITESSDVVTVNAPGHPLTSQRDTSNPDPNTGRPATTSAFSRNAVVGAKKYHPKDGASNVHAKRFASTLSYPRNTSIGAQTSNSEAFGPAGLMMPAQRSLSQEHCTADSADERNSTLKPWRSAELPQNPSPERVSYQNSKASRPTADTHSFRGEAAPRGAHLMELLAGLWLRMKMFFGINKNR